jgi:hypothetical protein
MFSETRACYPLVRTVYNAVQDAYCKRIPEVTEASAEADGYEFAEAVENREKLIHRMAVAAVAGALGVDTSKADAICTMALS